MAEASNLLVKFSRRLFNDTVEQAQFIEHLLHPLAFNPCILWIHDRPDPNPFLVEPALPWQPDFVDRLALQERPGKHPLHQEGYFYCLDFSSVFAISPLLTVPQPIRVIVDICASPGGKSVFAWRALQPELLISNEVIGKRMGALVSNLKRCQVGEAIALSRDSKILAEEIPSSADVVIVDAPCSGQSLVAKGDQAPGCFHPVNINKNANRQKRILANSAQVVAPGGYLAYMTCAYSPEENEQVSEWLLSRFPEFTPVLISFLQLYQSHLTSLPCYRMFPQAGLGAGAFTMLFRKEAQDNSQPHRLPPSELVQHLQRSGSVVFPSKTPYTTT